MQIVQIVQEKDKGGKEKDKGEEIGEVGPQTHGFPLCRCIDGQHCNTEVGYMQGKRSEIGACGTSYKQVSRWWKMEEEQVQTRFLICTQRKP